MAVHQALLFRQLTDAVTLFLHTASELSGDEQVQLEANVVMDENFWDDRYRSSDALWSGNPNPHLVSEVSGIKPGTALDISTVALQRAAASAKAAGTETASRITWLHADLTRWEPAAASYWYRRSSYTCRQRSDTRPTAVSRNR